MNFLIASALLSQALAGTVNVDIHKARSSTDRTRGNRFIRAAFEANEPSDVVPESLANGFYSYFASLYIGSNQQLVTPAVDTGSSDLWTMLSSNPYCANGDFDCTNQTFDPTTSTTFRNLSQPFDIKYLDTTGAFGTLAQDTITMDGKSVKNAYFAAASIANSSEDVFGVGLMANEATVTFNRNGSLGGLEYPNFPVSLKQQGFIDHVAYSLYLNDINAQDGQILFGGVDRAKYDDELAIVPIVNIYQGEIDVNIEFTIMLHGLGIRSGDNVCPVADAAIPFLLDSGTSYAILPDAFVDSMGTAMNYEWNNSTQYWQGSCQNDFDFDSFELNFSGKKLQAPPSTLLDLAVDNNQNPIYGPDGKQLCILAVQASNDLGDLILGDVFLRNFYVVYDLENLQIGLAQTKFDEEAESNVVPIESSIPGGTTAPGYFNTVFNTDVRTYANYSRCERAPQTSSSSAASSQAASSTKAYSSQHSTLISVSSGTPGSGSAAASSALAANATAAGATASVAGGAVAKASKVIVETTKYTTIPCSTPTTFSYNSQTYTVTEATTLTVVDCGCTETPVPVSETASGTGPSATATGPGAGSGAGSPGKPGAGASTSPAGSNPESTGAPAGSLSKAAASAAASAASSAAASAAASAASSGAVPSVGAVASSPSTATPALANGAPKLALGGLAGLAAFVLLL